MSSTNTNTRYHDNTSIRSSSDIMAGLGQQFLSNAGIDTEALYRRARHLQSNAMANNSTGGGGTIPTIANNFATATTSAAARDPTQTTTTAAPTPTPTVPPNPHDLLSFLQESHSAFFQTTIDHHVEHMQSVIQSKIQQRLQNNFYKTLASLGHSHVIQRIRVPIVSTDEEEEEEEGVGVGGGVIGGNAAAADSSIPFPSSIATTTATDLLQNDPSLFLQRHLEYFQMGPSASSTFTFAPENVSNVVSLEALMHFIKQQGGSIRNNEAYTNMISFLSCLSPTPTPAAATASVVARPMDNVQVHIQRNCMVALEFLSHQYKSYLIHSVKNSLSRIVVDGSSSLEMEQEGGMLGYIEKYVSMDLGSSHVQGGYCLEDTSGDGSGSSSSSSRTWVGAYHALRCGDLDCVLEILSRNKEGVDPCVVGLLREVLVGGKKKEEEEEGMRRLWRVMSSEGNQEKEEYGMIDKWKREVRELYARLEQQNRHVGMGGAAGGGGGKEYQLAVLGLLSFTPQMESCQSVQKTSEDYVFMELWKGMESVEECRERVCDLAENIKHYGPSYFEDGVDESYNMWIYAMLLFYCQQIRSGLNYLAGKSSDGLCVAVHLALGLVQRGVALTDLVREGQPKDTSKGYLSMLVSTFARGLQNSSPPLALYYLIQIPGPVQSGMDTKSGSPLSKIALDKICRLLLDTRAFQLLGGTLAGDGSRLANGALDRYFHKGAVSSILHHAAEYAMKEGKPADAAELLSLAGRYSDLLSLLNRRLSSLLVTDDIKERTFWRQASEQFLESYMSKGQMHVIQVLEKERQLPLGNTFQMLLNLMEFFDRCQDGKWEVSHWYRHLSFYFFSRYFSLLMQVSLK